MDMTDLASAQFSPGAFAQVSIARLSLAWGMQGGGPELMVPVMVGGFIKGIAEAAATTKSPYR